MLVSFDLLTEPSSSPNLILWRVIFSQQMAASSWQRAVGVSALSSCSRGDPSSWQLSNAGIQMADVDPPIDEFVPL